MSFYPSDRQVPDFLETAEYVLRPLSPAHVQVDYEAVMGSREMLQFWSGSDWPREGFTLGENLDDLTWHYQEHLERKAFTYTVLDPEQGTCLGCLYIRQLNELASSNPEELREIGQDAAMARFWVRTSRSAGDLEQRLLQTLKEWFEQDWQFSRLLFHTRKQNLQQVALFEAADLHKQLTLLYYERGKVHLFYGANTVS